VGYTWALKSLPDGLILAIHPLPWLIGNLGRAHGAGGPCQMVMGTCGRTGHGAIGGPTYLGRLDGVPVPVVGYVKQLLLGVHFFIVKLDESVPDPVVGRFQDGIMVAKGNILGPGQEIQNNIPLIHIHDHSPPY
jgi:hypothetical protein